MKRMIVLLMLVAFAGAGILCAQDAVSQASPKWGQPPSNYDYLASYVMGHDGYVIKYDDRMYRGKGFNAKGAERMKTFGVKTVITIHPGDKEFEAVVKAAGMKWIEFPFEHKVMPEEVKKKFLKLLKSNPGGIYLHSKELKQRAGAFAAIYRMHVVGWSYERTIIEYARLGGSLKDHDRLLKGCRGFDFKKKK